LNKKKGIVIKTPGSFYTVADENNIRDFKLAGKLRLEGIKATNPVAVGDYVLIDTENNLILDILPRKNYVLRESANLSKRFHILAANLDLLTLVITFKYPRTSKGFADRILATCEAYSVKPLIIFNKKDLLSPDDYKEINEWTSVYENIGYETLLTSILDDSSIENLKSKLLHKTTLFIGHSGSGKSSLLNKIIPGLHLKTREISKKFEKGKHTTTFAEMFIQPDLKVIDTPGIKEFGMARMKKYEIGDYFPEILKVKTFCKFHNCLHINEPGCSVLNAVSKGEIAQWRYENYLNILESSSYEAWKDE